MALFGSLWGRREAALKTARPACKKSVTAVFCFVLAVLVFFVAIDIELLSTRASSLFKNEFTIVRVETSKNNTGGADNESQKHHGEPPSSADAHAPPVTEPTPKPNEPPVQQNGEEPKLTQKQKLERKQSHPGWPAFRPPPTISSQHIRQVLCGIPSEQLKLPVVPFYRIPSIVERIKIQTFGKSIFYSFFDAPQEPIGVFRVEAFGAGSDELGICTLDFALRKVRYSDIILRGEDPRVFYSNKQLYVVDNHKNRIRMIRVNRKTLDAQPLLVPIEGKNLSFFTHKGSLYAISWFMPLRLFKCLDIDRTKWAEVPVRQTHAQRDTTYRGGTPGYPLEGSEAIFIGFGHRTTKRPLRHTPFYWKMDMRSMRIEVQDMLDGSFASNLVDPTSVFWYQNSFYLATAESNHWWYVNQKYETYLYKLVP